MNETVALLATRAPKLRKAVREAKKAGHAYVVAAGTLIPIDRVAADRPFYSGKHKRHGMNLQVIAGPHGDILWVSGALPGSVHDKKAEWIWGVFRGLGTPCSRPKTGPLTTPQASLHAADRVVAPPYRAFDAGLRPGPFPDRAASLLPGLLAATRTGLPPAGDDELTNCKIHHGLRHGVTSRSAGRTKGQG